MRLVFLLLLCGETVLDPAPASPNFRPCLHGFVSGPQRLLALPRPFNPPSSTAGVTDASTVRLCLLVRSSSTCLSYFLSQNTPLLPHLSPSHSLPYFLPYFLPLSPNRSLVRTRTSHTHTHSYTHTHSLSLSFVPASLFLSLSFSHARVSERAQPLSLMHSLSRSHAHTLSLSPCSFSQSLCLSRSRSRARTLYKNRDVSRSINALWHTR
jgi:hypothetical protein